MREELGDCKRCKLCTTRTNIVFGVGNPDADLVFVGEAPGADEDAQGEPFVGKAGQLLTKMIEAMGYARGDVYICNVLKCRPPGNRNPEPDEVAACEPFLKKQLGAIRPRMIVALGKFAVQCLLRDDSPISRLRGNFRTYEGIPLMPTFHPAYLLRDPSKKKLAWDDLKAVNAALARVGDLAAEPAQQGDPAASRYANCDCSIGASPHAPHHGPRCRVCGSLAATLLALGCGGSPEELYERGQAVLQAGQARAGGGRPGVLRRQELRPGRRARALPAGLPDARTTPTKSARRPARPGRRTTRR